MSQTLPIMSDLRVKTVRPLIPPQILLEEIPLTAKARTTVLKGRRAVKSILDGEDDRLLVVVGPCSIHDVDAALEYAAKLHAYAEDAAEDLLIVMRVYFEKPRTTVGWKGLINDPDMDGSFHINKGLRTARGLLVKIAEIGLPAGCEFLDLITPQYSCDLVSWGAIGARTTESQIHRELTSGLSMPTGFKNSTDGNIGVAIDACKSAQSAHVFLSVGINGLGSIVETEGNQDVHIILRGGSNGPNYTSDYVQKYGAQLEKAGLTPRLLIDCSHGNSSKQFERQSIVADNISKQLSNEATSDIVMGVMIESNLVEGKQCIPSTGRVGLKYGQSVTDGCISWETTVDVLENLRRGVRERRLLRGVSTKEISFSSASSDSGIVI
ncbi:hypothetical protein C8R42DRAFT_601175 [Lentinula raphanica]|nr:hypothetical protein C8R42DRAFT_601175 [Lentinula raphanica]